MALMCRSAVHTLLA